MTFGGGSSCKLEGIPEEPSSSGYGDWMIVQRSHRWQAKMVKGSLEIPFKVHEAKSVGVDHDMSQ